MPGRRRRGAAIIVALAAAGLSGCAEHIEYTQPTLKQISYGFESLADTDWPTEAARLRETGANAVSLSAGRPEWTAFDWSEAPDAAPAHRGADLLVPALAALDGMEVTLTIDALMPLALTDRPELAGVDADGARSTQFASVSALEGELGDRIVAYAAVIAERYEPDVIALTELMFDSATFGPADLASYRSHTGAEDWPRISSRIDTAHPSISAWRSDVITSLVARAAAAVHPHGVELAIDVRVNYQEPDRGRAESGHDYAQLAGVADRLVLWHFFDISAAEPSDIAAVNRAVRDAGIPVDQIMVQTGMWAETGDVIDPDALRRALEASASAGVARVSVTPASLLQEDHWAAISDVWN